MDTPKSSERYVPAAGWRWLTGVYDPVMALTMRERSWRGVIADRVLGGVPPGGVIVDVGSGTGTFAIDLKAKRPDVHVTGVDGDPEILKRARHRSGGSQVHWTQGLAADLPLEDGSCDAAVMSLLLHHLDTSSKIEAINEASRVLKSGGRLHIVDWGAPDRFTMIGFFLLRLLDGFSNTRVHREGSLTGLVSDSGFDEVSTWKRLRTFWGSLELIDCGSSVTHS